MGIFGFDDKFAMFDVTPVENQFILEYLPTAQGDFVKVYLYGLMQCYHPQEDMSITQMSHELNLSEEDILKAYRHWERRGLVRRISDDPPSFRYINVKQQFFMRDATPVDAAYESFAEALYAAFGDDRQLHGKETSLCYEWVEDMGLPPEVVLMMIQHLISIKGKHFSFSAAQKLAVELAEEKVSSIEDAEVVLGRNKQVWEGSRKIARRLGKRRNPSEDEMALYRKWIRDWGYTAEAIEAACAETTKGEPTFAYLDGILRGMMQRQGKAMTTTKQVEQARQGDADRAAPLKTLLGVMNIRGVSVNDGTLAMYDDMRKLYPDEIILMAGRECATQKNSSMDQVRAMLEAWQRKGLQTSQDVQAYITRFHDMNALVSALYEVWGMHDRPTAGDRALGQKWEDTLHLSREMILFCAEFAKDADKPMPYLDKLLSEYAAAGITTPEQAAAARAAHQAQYTANQAATPPTRNAAPRPPKVVREQQYTQREYQETTELPDWMQQKIKEMNGGA